MEVDLRARLIAAPALVALIAGRVDWIERPRADGLPSITLQLVTLGRSYTHDGATDLHGSGVQIDCWGATYAQAKAVADAAIAALEPAATVGVTRFDGAFVDALRDFDPETLPGGTRVFRRGLDIILWWEAV